MANSWGSGRAGPTFISFLVWAEGNLSLICAGVDASFLCLFVFCEFNRILTEQCLVFV